MPDGFKLTSCFVPFVSGQVKELLLTEAQHHKDSGHSGLPSVFSGGGGKTGWFQVLLDQPASTCRVRERVNNSRSPDRKVMTALHLFCSSENLNPDSARMVRTLSLWNMTMFVSYPGVSTSSKKHVLGSSKAGALRVI